MSVSLRVFGVVGVIVGLFYVVIGWFGGVALASIAGGLMFLAGCLLLTISNTWE